MEERKNVYLSLHKSFVREGIEYTDRATGEARTFNSATLPKGCLLYTSWAWCPPACTCRTLP